LYFIAKIVPFLFEALAIHAKASKGILVGGNSE